MVIRAKSHCQAAPAPRLLSDAGVSPALGDRPTARGRWIPGWVIVGEGRNTCVVWGAWIAGRGLRNARPRVLGSDEAEGAFSMRAAASWGGRQGTAPFLDLRRVDVKRDGWVRQATATHFWAAVTREPLRLRPSLRLLPEASRSSGRRRARNESVGVDGKAPFRLASRPLGEAHDSGLHGSNSTANETFLCSAVPFLGSLPDHSPPARGFS